MITELRIKHFAIIDDCHIHFNDGLTVLTGETGAGKSIIIDALSLLFGNPASDDDIKTGHDAAEIEGIFDIPVIHDTLKDFMESDNTLIIYRKISKTKKNVIRLNNQTVSLKKAREVTQSLVEIMGQHDQLTLLDPHVQLDLLDTYSKDVPTLLSDYSPLYSEYKSLEQRRQRLQDKSDSLDSRLEFIRFQIQDISTQHFKIGEEEQLLDQKKHFKTKDKELHYIQTTQQHLASVKNHLAEGITGLSHLSTTTSDQDSENPSSMQHFISTCDQFNETLHDIEHALEERIQAIKALNHLSIDDIETRLDAIYRYKTKYKKPTLDLLVEFYDALKKEEQDLLDLNTQDSELEKAFSAAQARCLEVAKALHQSREKVAHTLASRIETSMKELNFNYAKVDFNLHFSENALTSTGADTVNMMISTNAGEPLKPLRYIASGGELSRIILSIKSLIYSSQSPGTLVMDEVDTGIGGLTGLKLGDYIKLISKHTQTICITHLPQIAQYADTHYLISKIATLSATTTQIQALSASERQAELSRMAGGKDFLSTLNKS